MKKIKSHTQQLKWVGASRLVIVALAIVQLAACVKDDIYKTPHPNKGAVKVTTGWSSASRDVILPDNYLLQIGNKEQTVSGTTNAFATLFDEGSHNLLVYHMADGFSINGNIGTVNTLTKGTLHPQPDHLFSGTKSLDVIKDDTLRVTVPMQQHTRSLTLTLKLKSGDEQRIATTSATLTGIMSEIDLTTGEGKATNGKTTIPIFGLTTIEVRSGESSKPVLSAPLRLLGVTTTDRQILTLVITLTDGHIQTITTDMTEALRNFGSSTNPLKLDANLELVVGGEIGGSITDWTEVDNGNFPIH